MCSGKYVPSFIIGYESRAAGSAFWQIDSVQVFFGIVHRFSSSSSTTSTMYKKSSVPLRRLAFPLQPVDAFAHVTHQVDQRTVQRQRFALPIQFDKEIYKQKPTRLNQTRKRRSKTHLYCPCQPPSWRVRPPCPTAPDKKSDRWTAGSVWPSRCTRTTAATHPDRPDGGRRRPSNTRLAVGRRVRPRAARHSNSPTIGCPRNPRNRRATGSATERTACPGPAAAVAAAGRSASALGWSPDSKTITIC